MSLNTCKNMVGVYVKYRKFPNYHPNDESVVFVCCDMYKMKINNSLLDQYYYVVCRCVFNSKSSVCS